MKLTKKHTFRRAVPSLLIFAALSFQLVSTAVFSAQQTFAYGSAQPSGPVKKFVITYDSLPNENNKSTGVAENRAKYLWQKNRVMEDLSKTQGFKQVEKNFNEMPISTVIVDAKGEEALRKNKRITSISEDIILKSYMKDVIPLLGGVVATGFSDGTTNYTGAGTAVAILDSGYDNSHTMLSGKIVSEACFSAEHHVYINVIYDPSCPGDTVSSLATGSSAHDVGAGSSYHGSEVAGAAVGKAVTSGPDSFSGIAKDAKVIAIKATLKMTEVSGQPDLCGDGGGTLSSCYAPTMAGILEGLNRVLTIKNSNLITENITSVNISSGRETFYPDTTTCMQDSGSPAMAVAVTALKAVNIATTFASGNSGNTDAPTTTYNSNVDKIGWPACITDAIAVGSNIRSGGMAYYSNAGPRLDFVAPGGDTNPSGGDGGVILPDSAGGLDAVQGTSFAAPMVAGAWAVMREKEPTATVDTIKTILQNTGASITESRSLYTPMTHKRISIAAALASAESLNIPSITSLTPQSGTFTAGDSVSVAIAAPNATSCTSGDATTTITSGVGTISLTVTEGNNQYTVVCSDSSGHAAQLSVGVVAGASTTTPYPPNPSAGGNGEVLISKKLGVPDTGYNLLKNNPLATAIITLFSTALIIAIAKRHKKITQ